MRLVYMTLLSLCFMTIGQAQNNPIFSKHTATWCPNCGNWGWGYMEAMKEEFQTGPATLLGVHFSGDLENDAAIWFKNNLGASGQPRFYVNNQAISVGSNWSDKVEVAKDAATEMIASGMDIISFDGVSISDTDITANVNLSDIPNANTYVAVYAYENNVVNYQAAQGDDAIHPNVLRASLGAPEGIEVTQAGTTAYVGELDARWNIDEIGLLAVVYEKVGNKYEIRSSQAISNVASRVSTDELLDTGIFTYTDTDNSLIIEADNAERYELTLTDMTGQRVYNNTFTNQISIEKSQLITGMYVSTLRSGNKLVSQQIFIK